MVVAAVLLFVNNETAMLSTPNFLHEYQFIMKNVGLYTHPRNCFLSNPPQQVVDEKRIGDENQRRLCFIQPIHYRARGQYVFEGKKSGRHLFLIKKKNYQTLIGMIMTQILHHIFRDFFRKQLLSKSWSMFRK